MKNFYWRFVEQPKRYISSFVYKILGWQNDKIIQYKVNKHRGELCLDTFRVVKLYGWTDQYEDDYYYVIDDKHDIVLYSCVGGFDWLKNRLSGFEYERLCDVWELNNQSEEDVKKIIESKGIILK